MRPSLTLVTSKEAKEIFSKFTSLNSERLDKKDEVCHGFVVKIFTLQDVCPELGEVKTIVDEIYRISGNNFRRNYSFFKVENVEIFI